MISRAACAELLPANEETLAIAGIFEVCPSDWQLK